jgi:selenocysteine insertion sequence-binding protein 2
LTPATKESEDSGGLAWTAVSNHKQQEQQHQQQMTQSPKAAKKSSIDTPMILKKNVTPSKQLKQHQQQKQQQPKKAAPQQQEPGTGSKKSKKPKPKLKHMSIGDMLLPTNTKQRKSNSSNSKQIKPKVDNPQEFPALGAPAATTSTSNNNTTYSRVVWGAPKKQEKATILTHSITKGKTKDLASNSKDKKKTTKADKTKDTPVPKPSGEVASFFQPLQRSSYPGDFGGTTANAFMIPQQHRLDGEEHQLLRLMQERSIYQKKGRQRVAPRKKKFTALKKKVLQERLDRWRELHPETVPEAANSTEGNKDAFTNSIFSTICIYNYATPEELEDDDEYEETVENLKVMASKVGPINKILVPRESLSGDNADDDNKQHPVFVKFEKVADAAAAQGCWNNLVVGGSKLSVVGLDVLDDGKWSERVVAAEQGLRNPSEALKDHDVASDVEIFLRNVLADDDYEDNDCMEESLSDLRKLAEQHGNLQGIRSTTKKDGNVVLTYHCNNAAAHDILARLCGTVVGGQLLQAFMKTEDQKYVSKETVTILLENVLTEDDLEDEDCLSETLNDIKELCQQYGKVLDISAKGNSVRMTFGGDHAAGEKAVSELNGLILGGNVVGASLLDEQKKYIDLLNVLTEDDLKDEECLEESLADIRVLAVKYGVVSNIEVLRADNTASIRIHFDGDASVASEAAKKFDGMLIGGQICSVVYEGSSEAMFKSNFGAISESSGDKRKSQDQANADSVDKKARTDDKPPLYSGDKLIPERFAEMKRVPKIPNVPGRRDYAATITEESAKPLLIEMLGELMRLQKRATEEKNAKARRRLVMGLREVARGIRAHKVKMVVMANNLDQYGVIDEKLQEIIDLAKREGVPLFFEFTKRSLGKAIGKNIKIAVVGIQSADGAHSQFKKLNSIATRL